MTQSSKPANDNTAKDSKAAEAKLDYRVLNQELQTILAQLESDDLDIEASIAHYQRGMKVVAQLQTYLKEAQLTVEKVKASWE